MSKKHFRLLAEAIAGIPETAITDREGVADIIGKVCQKFNSNFNWDKWCKACDVRPIADEELRGTNFEAPEA